MKEAQELIWKQKLSLVGLDIKLVYEALGNTDEQCLQKIHTAFKTIRCKIPNHEQIELVKISMPLESWQIQLLSGKLEYYCEYKDKIDVNGNTIVVYAALAGKESLQFVFDTLPHLVLKTDTLFKAIFCSQSIELLEYTWETTPLFQDVASQASFEQKAIEILTLIDWPEGFQWLESKCPRVWHTQMYGDMNHFRAIHVIAVSHRMRLIEYLYNIPEKQYILHQRTADGSTIAHLFAVSGFLEGLFFISKHMPYMLQLDDNSQSMSCAHFAALSGDTALLDFFAMPCYTWQLFEKVHINWINKTETYDCAHLAWASGNPNQLNRALALSKNPRLFEINLNEYVISKLNPMALEEDLPTILNNALNDNFHLENMNIVCGGFEWTSELYQEINQKLVRNYLSRLLGKLFVFYQCMKSTDFPADIFISLIQPFLITEELNRIQGCNFEKKTSISDFDQTFFAQIRLDHMPDEKLLGIGPVLK